MASGGRSYIPQSLGSVHSHDAAKPLKQDLPPKGGYQKINYQRIPPRKIVNGIYI